MEPLLNAKILRARAILHKEFVTDEDIFSLEHQAAFGELHLAPRKVVAALDPPKNLPKPPVLAPTDDGRSNVK